MKLLLFLLLLARPPVATVIAKEDTTAHAPVYWRGERWLFRVTIPEGMVFQSVQTGSIAMCGPRNVWTVIIDHGRPEKATLYHAGDIIHSQVP